MFRWAAGLLAIVVAIVAAFFGWPQLSNFIDRTLASQKAPVTIGDTDHDEHAHDSHDHDSHGTTGDGRDVGSSLELTPQAMNNLGLTLRYLRPVRLSTYRRSITVPAVVVAKPGRSSIIVSSPLNGVVTHVHAVTGEAVLPGDLLFEVRLTYEDLVETQTAYLKTISELQVEEREISRLEQATQSGAISGKVLLERRYAREKLEAFARSQREALRMHGLSDRQVDSIGKDGKLLRELKIVAPDVDTHDHHEELQLSQLQTKTVSYTLSPASQLIAAQDSHADDHSQHALVIDELQVHKGQAIMAGEELCSLSDYSQLFIEGKAFETDTAAITEATKRGWNVDAVLRGSSGQEIVSDLKVVFVSNSIDPESRTLSLFVELPNEIVRDETNASNQRFLSWQYRLGQRLELRVPVEEWQDQIVLPVDAVVKDGADWFVFEKSGNRFIRVPVHVRYRDQSSVVVANDGSIHPGDVIALRAAHQLQMAIKNQSGGAVDPHAGHNH
ncbi:efflux RND transporter periplasmic adaptor subunit [Rubripirellula amarantea]|nr:efflux RND transporter periplasmic adaptor subunit [Rubripirellula amarantea]MDA8744395.1 efflux RND transporter periplasmic adaptor subunit [Rubripirellula amarantea]